MREVEIRAVLKDAKASYKADVHDQGCPAEPGARVGGPQAASGVVQEGQSPSAGDAAGAAALSRHVGFNSNDRGRSSQGKRVPEISSSPRLTRPKRRRFRSVAACADCAWTMVRWLKANPGKKYPRRFKCKLWRHEGPCADQRLYRDFLKVREGVLGRLKDSAYVVLTHDAANPEIDQFDHWSDLSSRWDRILKPALQKRSRWGKFKYTQTWEQTRKGRAHVNVGIVSPIVRTWCTVPECPHVSWKPCPNKNKWCRNCHGHAKGQGRLCRGWSAQRKVLQAAAVAAGFGGIVWLAPVETVDQFASYLNKRTSSPKQSADGIANELTSSAAKGQLPIYAPARFRRIRFSQDWPTPVEHQVTCVCGHTKFEHVRGKAGKPTPCCAGGGECECSVWQKPVSEWTGELRQKPIEQVKADLALEVKGLESSREDPEPAPARWWDRAVALQRIPSRVEKISDASREILCPEPAADDPCLFPCEGDTLSTW